MSQGVLCRGSGTKKLPFRSGFAEWELSGAPVGSKALIIGLMTTIQVTAKVVGSKGALVSPFDNPQIRSNYPPPPP